MYYAESISLSQAEPLLSQCGLKCPENANYTAGVFDDTGKLLATGSLAGDMIQGVAVDPAHQGEDLLGKLLTHLYFNEWLLLEWCFVLPNSIGQNVRTLTYSQIY